MSEVATLDANHDLLAFGSAETSAANRASLGSEDRLKADAGVMKSNNAPLAAIAAELGVVL